MRVLERLEDYTPSPHSVILTIGNFDGMHRGHHAVLRCVQSLAEKEGQTVVLTFCNHPSEVLKPEQPTQLLCTLPHKLQLLQAFGIDKIILLPFTHHLAQHSAASFIEHIRQFVPFSHLVLGHDATVGRDRQGDRTTIQALGTQWGFTVHYIDEYRFEGQSVSSTRVRNVLQQGLLDQVEALLNRPYSIYASVSSGIGQGKQIGFPTANLEVAKLCLPPFGVYAVEVIKDSLCLPGIANIGIAPTIKIAAQPVLEIHLFDTDQNLYGHYLEVIFKKFIRSEKKFDHLYELQQQILQDIAYVKQQRSI